MRRDCDGATVGRMAEHHCSLRHSVGAVSSEIGESFEREAHRVELRSDDVPARLVGEQPEVEQIGQCPVQCARLRVLAGAVRRHGYGPSI